MRSDAIFQEQTQGAGAVMSYTPVHALREGDADEALRALVLRQMRAWEAGDFDLAAGDWHPDGVLVSPSGRWRADELRLEMTKLHAHYHDLTLTLKNLFATPDGRKLALEWDWTLTRRKDGARGTTPDAIIVDLEGGKILSWREYFDLSGSVEAPDEG